MKYLYIISFLNLLLGYNKKEEFIIDFLEARYSGDTLLVQSMVTNDFKYIHTPYVGLNMITSYSDGNLIVTGFIFDDSTSNKLQIGDKIHEINGKTIPNINLPINGREGDKVQVVFTKASDSTFTNDTLKLQLLQYLQNTESFIQDIFSYDQVWYDFHLEVINIMSRKDNTMIYYHWEGSKIENGPVYHFFSIEIIQREKSTGLIKGVEGLWSEKQLLDQFK